LGGSGISGGTVDVTNAGSILGNATATG
jgi:hypothetical protein